MSIGKRSGGLKGNKWGGDSLFLIHLLFIHLRRPTLTNDLWLLKWQIHRILYFCRNTIVHTLYVYLQIYFQHVYKFSYLEDFVCMLPPFENYSLICSYLCVWSTMEETANTICKFDCEKSGNSRVMHVQRLDSLSVNKTTVALKNGVWYQNRINDNLFIYGSSFWYRAVFHSYYMDIHVHTMYSAKIV